MYPEDDTIKTIIILKEAVVLVPPHMINSPIC